MLCVASQAALATLSLQRLRFVAADVAAARGKRMLIATVFSSLGACVAYATARFANSAFWNYMVVLTVACAGVLFVAFQVNAFVALRRAAQKAMREAELAGFGAGEAVQAMKVANLLALSASSTLCYLLVFAFRPIAPVWIWWVWQVVSGVNVVADAALAMFAAGVLHDDVQADPETTYRAVGTLVKMRRTRLIREKLLASTTATSGPALAVAALLEEMPVIELVDAAMARFRSIQWDTLAANDHIITKGGLLQDVGAGGEGLYMLSVPCAFSGCDVFWSHSWRDDGVHKMCAVRKWAAVFRQREHRWPSLWLDKVCVDQTTITQDLQCLPVFLAGCNSILVTSETTYASRLWCALELFVYFSMVTEDEARSPPTVLLLAPDALTKACIHRSWLLFDVSVCDCFHEEDKARILNVMEQFPGGVLGFNNYIRGLASTMLGSVMQSDGADAGTPLATSFGVPGWSEACLEHTMSAQASL